MNYRPMFEFASGERLGNAQVFATREEAQSSAEDRFRVWTMPTGYDVDETADAVTYRWTTDGDARLPLEEGEA
jgi:hypothetical protein